MTFDVANIEDAFVDALQPLKAEGLRTLDSYGDELRTPDMERIARRLPAIFVTWSGGNMAAENQVDIYTTQVLVLVFDQDLRGEKAARRGAGVSPGAYYWLRRCRELLGRQRLLPGWTPARMVSEGPLGVADHMVAYRQLYELKARIA